MALPDSIEWARAQDEADPLAWLRHQFALPRGSDGQPLLYLCGHSLGLAPIAARAAVDAEIEDWERLAVLGHEQARHPWIGYAEQLQPQLAQLSGALPVDGGNELAEREPAPAAGEFLSPDACAQRHHDRGRRVLLRPPCRCCTNRLARP